jgi:hypothetical protein
MKINEYFVSIPPHISVSWREVSALYMKEGNLYFKLKNGETIVFQEPKKEETDALFLGYAAFQEQEAIRTLVLNRLPLPLPLPIPFDPEEFGDTPIGFKIGTSEGIISAARHNPAQAKNPTLSNELFAKIILTLKFIGINGRNVDQLPRGVPDCNCFFCQIMNQIQKEIPPEEKVTEEDLKFREWNITDEGNQCYLVENPSNREEQYRVSLAPPVGCTCNQAGCEHIIAVLKS